MKRFVSHIMFIFFLLAFYPYRSAQAQINPTTGSSIMKAMTHRSEMDSRSLIRDYPVRSVGPIVMAGRVTDLAVNPDSSKIFYIAYASGGIFKTSDNGISFTPVFDNQGTTSIGDIALFKANPDIIWVGTGEVNSSRSSYAGTGVYKSVNGGKTWNHMGLKGTEHIGRVITHPTNPDIVWVAAEGPLYSNDPDRGVYKTTDGGKTWKKTLFVNDSTGVIDLAINPDNPEQLWAATWTRRRYAWNFIGSGPGSAIYESNDGGNTWHVSIDGFITGPDVGRIGLSVCHSKPNVVYAVVDNQTKVKEKGKNDKNHLSPDDLRKMSVEDVLKLDDAKLNDFLRHNGFPERYTPAQVKKDLKKGLYTPKDIADYNHEGADEQEVSSSVVGTEVYRSDDYGKHWNKVNRYKLPGIYYTYGYYFAQIRVNPDNPDDLYILGVPVLHSVDGGKTYSLVRGDMHSDNHAFWYDPSDPQHIMIGTDGGAYTSWDAGKHWAHFNSMPVGQFYSVAVDRDYPFNIYGGLQDNGVFYGSSQSVPNHSDYWKRLLGGDGMHVVVDTSDNETVYTGFQFGNYFRIDQKTGNHVYITPKHNIGEPQYRWNWNTPIRLSPHNQDIVYMGSQKLLRSMDRGDHFEEISPDLTTNFKPQGNVPYSTITTIAESPLKFGVIWVGTDDGNVQLTIDGGVHWKLVSSSLPQKLWVSKVFASPYNDSTAFVSLTGYRYDDFHPYVYETTDFGKVWKPVNGNLPNENVNVIVQDPVNPSLLFIGTDNGAYVSFDSGINWQMIGTRYPGVPAYDMEIQPDAHDLVIATHGRSMFVMHVKPLEQLTPDKLGLPIVAYEPDSVRFSSQWGKSTYPYMKPDEPDVALLYYIGKQNGTVTLDVLDAKGTVVSKQEIPGTNGFHQYHLSLETRKKSAGKSGGKYLGVGIYSLVFHNGSSSDKATLIIYNRIKSRNKDASSSQKEMD